MLNLIDGDMLESRLEIKCFKTEFKDLLQVFANQKLLHYTDLELCKNVDDPYLKNWCTDAERISFSGFVNDEFVGFASAHLVRKHLTASLTVVVLEEFQGRGYAKLLLENLVKHLASIGIVRVEAQVCTENVASAAMLETLGFQREGILRKNFLIEGHLYDSYMFAKIVRP
ncbi:MAG: GNAT family N-acetyltransferase [Bacteroidales bacterium]|nr:GNAT family N-acetyltransferase [Bacteroidales bacterium]